MTTMDTPSLATGAQAALIDQNFEIDVATEATSTVNSNRLEPYGVQKMATMYAEFYANEYGVDQAGLEAYLTEVGETFTKTDSYAKIDYEAFTNIFGSFNLAGSPEKQKALRHYQLMALFELAAAAHTGYRVPRPNYKSYGILGHFKGTHAAKLSTEMQGLSQEILDEVLSGRIKFVVHDFKLQNVAAQSSQITFGNQTETFLIMPVPNASANDYAIDGPEGGHDLSAMIHEGRHALDFVNHEMELAPEDHHQELWSFAMEYRGMEAQAKFDISCQDGEAIAYSLYDQVAEGSLDEYDKPLYDYNQVGRFVVNENNTPYPPLENPEMIKQFQERRDLVYSLLEAGYHVTASQAQDIVSFTRTDAQVRVIVAKIKS